MTNLFTYGSLMSEDIMHHVSGCKPANQTAILHNFRRVKVRNEHYPGLYPKQGTSVNGRIYFDLPPQAINRLDIFEGEYYSRENVTVQTGAGEEKSTMAYIFKPTYYHLLSEEEWLYSEFLATGKSEFVKDYFGFDKIS